MGTLVAPTLASSRRRGAPHRWPPTAMKPQASFALGQALAGPISCSLVMAPLYSMPLLRHPGVLLDAAAFVVSIGVGAWVAGRSIAAIEWRSDLAWYFATIATRCLALPLSLAAMWLFCLTLRPVAHEWFPHLVLRLDQKRMDGMEFILVLLVLVVVGIPAWCAASAIAERVWQRSRWTRRSIGQRKDGK